MLSNAGRDERRYLFDFLKLVDPEDTPRVPPVGTGFLTETGRETSVSFWQFLFGLGEPFVGMIGGDGLFRGCDQVFVVLTVA